MVVDIVFPNNNEAEFLKVAERLGIQGLVFVYENPIDAQKIRDMSGKIKVYCGILVKDKNQLNRCRNKYDLILARKPSRDLFLKGVDILFELETENRKDFMHNRNSGLDQVLCMLAKENRSIVGFNFNSLLSGRTYDRAVIMGRISQNIRFARKFKLPAAIFSGARKPYELRFHRDIAALFAVSGMHPADVQNALKSIYERLKLNASKSSGKYIAEGIERL